MTDEKRSFPASPGKVGCVYSYHHSVWGVYPLLAPNTPHLPYSCGLYEGLHATMLILVLSVSQSFVPTLGTKSTVTIVFLTD